jgi:hypothetical protein
MDFGCGVSLFSIKFTLSRLFQEHLLGPQSLYYNRTLVLTTCTCYPKATLGLYIGSASTLSEIYITVYTFWFWYSRGNKANEMRTCLGESSTRPKNASNSIVSSQRAMLRMSVKAVEFY